MRSLAGVTIAMLAAGSVSLSAQSNTADGVTALARGDYQRAAELLRPIAEQDGARDPAAQFFLGSMYEAGLGVPRDPLRACALYHRASIGDREPFTTAAMRLHKAAFQRHGAEFFAECQLLGNLGFDNRFEPVTFELEPGHTITWSLRGAAISYAGRTIRHEMRLAGRGAAYLPIRHTALPPHGPKGRIRHFNEVFVWSAGLNGAWSLNWHLFEIAGGDLVRIADEPSLMTSPVKPAASPPRDVRQRVAVRMNADGKAEWAIVEGTPTRTELIESDEERREVRELEAAERAALDGVDWNRRVEAHRLPSFSYFSSGGCGNVVLYGMTRDRAETISVRASRSELQLSTTARTFDIARHPTTIVVNVNVYGQPMRHAEDCDDVRVSPGPATQSWRAVTGRVTIELSPPGVRARTPWLYRATIRIDNAEFIDSSGRKQRQAGPIVLSGVVGSGPG